MSLDDVRRNIESAEVMTIWFPLLRKTLLVDSQLKFAIISLASSIVGVNGVVNIRDRAGILRTAVSVAAAACTGPATAPPPSLPPSLASPSAPGLTTTRARYRGTNLATSTKTWTCHGAMSF